MALLPVGIASNKTAIDQTAAMNVLASVAADLRTTSLASSTTSRFGISIPAANQGTTAMTSTSVAYSYIGADGQPYATLASGSNVKYQLTATAMAPGEVTVTSSHFGIPPGTHNRPTTYYLTGTYSNHCATQTYLKLTWPAQASGTNIAGSVETVVLMDRN